MRRKLHSLLLALALPSLAAAETVQVTDASILPGQSVTWTYGNTYVLNGFVFVDSSATLTIQPGVVVKGKPGQGANASALIVARGGKIYASGTPSRPIIFTAEADDPDKPDDLAANARGLWGGLILLGRARLNSSPGQTAIEGIPTTEPRGSYGGSDDSDNSGVVRYVSIRHGGTVIGANNEINGLTLGGVGNGTTVEYVEVYNNADDGFEFFGGTVNTKYLVSAFNDDDSFDYDEGWRGKNQFWFAIQGATVGNRGAECDGGTTPQDGTPYAIPQIYNATFIGSGSASTNSSSDIALILRENAGGKWYNSIFTEFFGKGVDVQDLSSGEDSRNRLDAGDLVLANSLWYGFGAGNTLDKIAPQTYVQTHLSANSNRFADPMLGNIDRSVFKNLDPRPKAGSPALSGAATPTDAFFTPTTYVGAFGTRNWMEGWTVLFPANRPPQVSTRINNQSLKANGADFVQDLSAVFSDPDGNALTYWVTSSNRNVALASVSGTTLKVTPRRAGLVRIKVSASDGKQTTIITFTATVAAAKEAGALPLSLSLSQNYPNPFNPGTQINYTLPAEGMVRLSIYDLAGQRVVQLVEGTQAAGQHIAEFNAAGLPSGTYFYRLEAGSEVLTRKMTLLK
ncbi:MAG: T9SS type A sorting domain-containing protein [Candidatus Handelsmanbacteria bacterium]|nr:T9SS type A sorting domain-containing protein [Candidatus Handelsmanbacteria bacterium]